MIAPLRWMPLLTAIVAAAGLSAPRLAQAQDTFRCESRSHQTNYCDIDTRGGIELVRQLSHAGCWEGDTWGYDRRGVWVSNGCRAEFASVRGYHNDGRRNDYRDDRYEDNDDDNTGAVVAGAVVLGLIGAAMLADDNDNDNDHDDGRRGGQRGGSITCESEGGRYRHCPINVGRGRVEIERVLSRAECRYGQTWGSDRAGVWVDGGCRARFSIR